jgi:hypothetical protein
MAFEAINGGAGPRELLGGVLAEDGGDSKCYTRKAEDSRSLVRLRGPHRVESSHLRSLSLRGERGNHTIYFCGLLRVTVRVNLGAMRGYVRP